LSIKSTGLRWRKATVGSCISLFSYRWFQSPQQTLLQNLKTKHFYKTENIKPRSTLSTKIEKRVLSWSEMKKLLLVFAAALGVSFVLFLVKILRSYLTTFSGLTYPFWALVLYSLINFLIVIPVVFVPFYFLAKKGKIKAEKAIVLALILGLLAGNIFNQWSFDFQDRLFFVTSDVFNYLNYLSANFFFLFFPAIAAFLFVELKERKQTIA
jgi:hypothetical protein